MRWPTSATRYPTRCRPGSEFLALAHLFLDRLPFPGKSHPILVTPSLVRLLFPRESCHELVKVPATLSLVMLSLPRESRGPEFNLAAPSLGELPFPRKSRPETGVSYPEPGYEMPYEGHEKT